MLRTPPVVRVIPLVRHTECARLSTPWKCFAATLIQGDPVNAIG